MSLHVIFDEWKDILVCTVYVEVLKQNTPVVGKILFWGPGWKGGDKFSVLLKGEQKIFMAAYGEQMFFSAYFQFQEPPGGNK